MSGRPSQERLIVVPYKPGLKFRQRLMAWVAVLIGMVGGLGIGAAGFYTRYTYVVSQLEHSKSELAESKKEQDALRQELAILERGRAIDQKAGQDVQRTIQRLEETIARLREDANFYKNILAPSEDNKGLKVQRWEVQRLQERRYRYKLVLAQVSENKDFVEGVAAISFIGLKNGEAEIIPLRDLSDMQELGIKFRFRYFQELTGELTLPEDFRPEQIQVVVQSKGRNATKFEQTFLWKREDLKSDVGKK